MTSPAGTPIIHNLLQRMNLRYPTLFVILGLLLVVDILIPDFIPPFFDDEIVLALLTLLFGSWKARRENPRNPDAAGRAPVRKQP